MTGHAAIAEAVRALAAAHEACIRLAAAAEALEPDLGALLDALAVAADEQRAFFAAHPTSADGWEKAERCEWRETVARREAAQDALLRYAWARRTLAELDADPDVRAPWPAELGPAPAAAAAPPPTPETTT